jgi:uncharacterized protein (TIGR03118 family)
MRSLTRMSVVARTKCAAALSAATAIAIAVPALAQDYARVDLVTNVCCGPERFDLNLAGGWGVAMGAAGPAWVVSTDTARSTLYDGTGVLQSLVVRMEVQAGFAGSSPSGIVANPGAAFQVTDDSAQTGPARFIFATREGTITAWKPPAAGRPPNTIAHIVVNNTALGGPQETRYTGLAITTGAGGDFLYATDFAHGRIDTFNGSFTPVAAEFRDPQLPAGYAPFNARVLNGRVYVIFAIPDVGNFDAAPSPGSGIVDVFGLDGSFQKRLVSNGPLNAPWGMALAPAGFGPLSGTLLVGNSGDGRVNGFNPDSGEFVGTLHDTNGPIIIDGVRGLQFGNGSLGQAPTTLYYAAAPTFALVGIYGRVDFGTPFQLPPRCGADFNDNGRLSAQDIFDFLTSWFAGNLLADFDRSGALTTQDVLAFLGAWFAGCP